MNGNQVRRIPLSRVFLGNAGASTVGAGGADWMRHEDRAVEPLDGSVLKSV